MSKSARDEYLEPIREALEGLQFGEVVIAVHDGEIVQINRTEKMRTLKQPGRR